jgi:predicted nucleic-acid-binding protein
MLAIDTNLIVRYLTDDDPEQAARSWRVRALRSERPERVSFCGCRGSMVTL